MHRIKKKSVLKSRNWHSQKRPNQSKAKTQQRKWNILQFYVPALGVLVDISCATTALGSPSLQVCCVNICNLFLGWAPPCVCSLPWQISRGHSIFPILEASLKLVLHLHSFIQWPSWTSMQETQHWHTVRGFGSFWGLFFFFFAGFYDFIYFACLQSQSPSLKPIDSGLFHHNCSSPCLPWLVGRAGRIHLCMVMCSEPSLHSVP